MKFLLLLATLFLSTLSHAQELTAVYSTISCIGREEMDLLKYRVGLLAKNTGKENLVLITKFDGMTLVNKSQIFFLDAGAQPFDGTMIFPPGSDLGLVELYPGEGAEINGFLYSSEPLKGEMIISYEVRDSYDGRYKNWEGMIKAKPTLINYAEKCAL
jgi:hypothetical protein